MSRRSSTPIQCVDGPTVEITPSFLADLVPCISPLSSTAVSSLLSQASLVTLPPKRVLYRESDDARYTYIVLDGFVGVFVEGIQRLIHVRNLLESEALGGATALTHLSNHERKRRKERKRSEGVTGSVHASAAVVGALALQDAQPRSSRDVLPGSGAAHTSKDTRHAQSPHASPRQSPRPSPIRSRNARPRPSSSTPTHTPAQTTSEPELTTATSAAPIPGMLSYLSPNPFPAHAPTTSSTAPRCAADALSVSSPSSVTAPPAAALPVRPVPPSHPRPTTARPATATVRASRASRPFVAININTTTTLSTATATTAEADTAHRLASPALEPPPSTTPLPLVQHGIPARLPTLHPALGHQPHLPRGLSIDHALTDIERNQPSHSLQGQPLLIDSRHCPERQHTDITDIDSRGACAPAGPAHGLLVEVPSLLDSAMLSRIDSYDVPLAESQHASSRDCAHSLSHNSTSSLTVPLLQPSSSTRTTSHHSYAHAHVNNDHSATSTHTPARDTTNASASAGDAAVGSAATSPVDANVGEHHSTSVVDAPNAAAVRDHGTSADAPSPLARTPRASLRGLASPRRSLLSPRTLAHAHTQAPSPRPSRDHALNTPRASAASRDAGTPRSSTLTPRGSILTPRASLAQAHANSQAQGQTPSQGGDAAHARTHTSLSARSHTALSPRPLLSPRHSLPAHSPTPPATPRGSLLSPRSAPREPPSPSRTLASPRPLPRQSPRPSLSRTLTPRTLSASSSSTASPFAHAPTPAPALFTRALRRQRPPPRPPSPLPSPSLPTRKTRPYPRYAPLPSLPARATAEASAAVEHTADALTDCAALTAPPTAEANDTAAASVDSPRTTGRLGHIPTGAALPPAMRAALTIAAATLSPTKRSIDFSPAASLPARTPRLSLRSVPRLGSPTPSPYASTLASPVAPPTRAAPALEQLQTRLLDLFASPIAPLFPTPLVTVQDLADTRAPAPASSAPIVLSLRVGTRIYHVHRIAPLDAAPPPSPRTLHAPLLAALPARARAALQGFLRRLTRIHARPRMHTDAQSHRSPVPVADALSQRPLATAARVLTAPRTTAAQPHNQGATAGSQALQVPPGAPVGLTIGALTTLLQDASLPALMRALSALEPSAATQVAAGAGEDEERAAALRLVSDPFVVSLLSGIHQRAPAAQALKASGLLQHFLRHGIDPASVFRAVTLSDKTGAVSVGSQEASVPLMPQPTALPLSAFSDLARPTAAAALAARLAQLEALPLPAQRKRQRYKQLLTQCHVRANALPDADGGLSRALESVGTPDGPDLRSVLLRYLALQRAGAPINARSRRPQRGGRDVLTSLLSHMGEYNHATLYSALRAPPSRTDGAGAAALLQREAERADWRGREQSRAVHRIREHRADMAARSRKHALVFRDLATLLQQHRHRLAHPNHPRTQADAQAFAGTRRSSPAPHGNQDRAQASPPARRRTDLRARMGVAVVLDALAAHNTRVRQSMSVRDATARTVPLLMSAASRSLSIRASSAASRDVTENSGSGGDPRADQRASTIFDTNKPAQMSVATVKKRRIPLLSLSLVLLRVLRETKPLLLRPKAKRGAPALTSGSGGAVATPHPAPPPPPRADAVVLSRPSTGTHASPSTPGPVSTHAATLASLRADHALAASRDAQGALGDAPGPSSPAPSAISTSLVLPSALCVRVEPFSPTASAPSSATSAVPHIGPLQAPNTSSTAPPASSRLRVSRADYLEDDTLSPLPVFATSTRANGGFSAHARTFAAPLAAPHLPLPHIVPPHTAASPALASPLTSLPAAHFPYSHLPRSPAAAETTRASGTGTAASSDRIPLGTAAAPVAVDAEYPRALHPYPPRPAPLSIPASVSTLSTTASPHARPGDATPSPTWSFSIPPSPSSRMLASPSHARLSATLTPLRSAHAVSRPMPKPASPTASAAASRAPSRAASASRTRARSPPPASPSSSSRSSCILAPAPPQPVPSPRASTSVHSSTDAMVLPTGSFVPAVVTHVHAHAHVHTPSLRSSGSLADTRNSPERTRSTAAHSTLTAPGIYHAALPPFQRMWCRVPVAPRGCTLRLRLVPVAKPVVHAKHPALASPRRAHSRRAHSRSPSPAPSPAPSPRAHSRSSLSLSQSPTRTDYFHDAAEDCSAPGRTTFTLTRMPLTPRTPSSARTSFFGAPRSSTPSASRSGSPNGDPHGHAHELSADTALLELVTAARVEPTFAAHKDMSLYGSFTHTHPSPQEHAFAATADHHALKLTAPTSAENSDAVDADLDRLSRASISTSAGLPSSPVPPSEDTITANDWDVLPLICPPAPASSRWLYVCVTNNASAKQHFHLQIDCPRLDAVTGTLAPPVHRVDDLRGAHLLATLGTGHMPDVAELLVRVATRSFTVANHTDRPATLLRLPTAALRSLFAQPHRAAVHARRLLVATATVLAATLYMQASATVRRLVLQRASTTALAHMAGGLPAQQLGDILQCFAGATRTYALPREATVTNDVYVGAHQRDAYKAAEMRLGVVGAPLARRYTGRAAHRRGFVTKPRAMATMRRTDMSRRLLSLAGREEHVSTGVKLLVRGDGNDAREGTTCAVDDQALRDVLPAAVSREYHPAVVHVLPADAVAIPAEQTKTDDQRASTGGLHHSSSDLVSARTRTVLALAHDDLSERAMATAARSLRSGSAVVLARDAAGIQERVHRIRSARVAAIAGAQEVGTPAATLRDVSQPRDDALLRRVSRRLLGTPKEHAPTSDAGPDTRAPAHTPGWSGLPRSGTGDGSSRQLWPHQPSALQLPLSASVPAKVHPLGDNLKDLNAAAADGVSLARVHAALASPVDEAAKPPVHQPLRLRSHPSLASVSRPHTALRQRRAAQVPLPQEPTTIYVDRASERALAVLVRREHYVPRDQVVVPAHLDLTLRTDLVHGPQDALRDDNAVTEAKTASIHASSPRNSPRSEHVLPVNVAPGRARSPPPPAAAAPVFAARAGPGLLLDTSVDSDEYSPRSCHSPRSRPHSPAIPQPRPSRPGSPTSPTPLPPRPLSPTGFLLPAHLRSVTRPEALSPLSAAQYASALWAARSVERPASAEPVTIQLSPAFSGRSHASPPPYDATPALLSPPVPTAVPSPLPLTSRARRKSTAPVRVDDSFYLHSRLTNVFQQWPLRHDDSSDDEEYIEKDHVARVRNENRALVALIRKKVAWMATNGLSAPARARRRSLAGDSMDVDGLLSPSEERAIRRVMQRRGSVLAMFADDFVGSDPPVTSRARKLSIVRVGSPMPDRATTASPPPLPASRVPIGVRPTRTARVAGAPAPSAPAPVVVESVPVGPPQPLAAEVKKVDSTLSTVSSHPATSPPTVAVATPDTTLLPVLTLELPPSPRTAVDCETRPLDTPSAASPTGAPREDAREAASGAPVLVATPPALCDEVTATQILASPALPALSAPSAVASPRAEAAAETKASGEIEDSSEFFASTPTNDMARSFFQMRAAAVASAAGAVTATLPDAAVALALARNISDRAQAAQLPPAELARVMSASDIGDTTTLLRALSPALVSAPSPLPASHSPLLTGFHPRVESLQHARPQSTCHAAPVEASADAHAIASFPREDVTSSPSSPSSSSPAVSPIGPAPPQLPRSSSTMTLPMLPALDEPPSYRSAFLPESNVPLDYGASAPAPALHPTAVVHPSLTRASSEFSFSRRPESSSPVLSNRPSLRHRSPGLALRSLGLSVLELPHPTVPCSPGLPYLSLESSFSYSYTPTPTVPVVSPVAVETRPNDVPHPTAAAPPAPATLLRRLSLGYERTPAAAALPKHVPATGSTTSTRSSADAYVGVQRDTHEKAQVPGLHASTPSRARTDADRPVVGARPATVSYNSHEQHHRHAPKGLNSDLLSASTAMMVGKHRSNRTMLPATPAKVITQQNLIKQKQLRQQAYRRVRQTPLDPEQILK